MASEAIFQNGNSIPQVWRGGTVEVFLHGMAGASLNASVIIIEVNKDDEWKTGEGMSIEAGNENHLLPFELKAGNRIRASVSGGALPAGAEVRIS